jgi:hypothetical protein
LHKTHAAGCKSESAARLVVSAWPSNRLSLCESDASIDDRKSLAFRNPRWCFGGLSPQQKLGKFPVEIPPILEKDACWPYARVRSTRFVRGKGG